MASKEENVAMLLTTERLLLREFVESDWPTVLAYQSDPRYLRYYHWTERNEKDVREFVQTQIASQYEQPRTKFQLAIALRENQQLIGNCGIRMKSADAHEADIGYELDPKYWGHGYATEAASAMVRFGFEELKVHRIWAWCIAENAASAHVLEKLGMRLEGRLRDKEQFKGRWWDTLNYGILDHEWKTLQEETTEMSQNPTDGCPGPRKALERSARQRRQIRCGRYPWAYVHIGAGVRHTVRRRRRRGHRTHSRWNAYHRGWRPGHCPTG
jgi:RimJ/RimL family protein N-acetyltransferase